MRDGRRPCEFIYVRIEFRRVVWGPQPLRAAGVLWDCRNSAHA